MRRPSIIAHHLVFYAYGQWLSNDLRGSGSAETRKESLRGLGPVHQGRKPPEEQPTRGEIKAFYREAAPLLNHPVVWFDDAKRQAVGEAFGKVVAARGYLCWACAVCSNHAHALIRVHRDEGHAIWAYLAEAAAMSMREILRLSDHPVWADRPYDVYKQTPDAVRKLRRLCRRQPRKREITPSVVALCRALQQLALPQEAPANLKTPLSPLASSPRSTKAY